MNDAEYFPLSLPKLPGIQFSGRTWAASDTSVQTVATVAAPPEYRGLWDVSLHGYNVQFRIQFGSSTAIVADLVRTPARFGCVGECQIEARKIDAGAPAEARCAIAYATGAGAGRVRAIRTGTGVAVALNAFASRITALDAVVATVGGVAVALAAGESIPVAWPATLTSGTIVEELVL